MKAFEMKEALREFLKKKKEEIEELKQKLADAKGTEAESNERINCMIARGELKGALELAEALELDTQ